ncbi:hypothetical protein [Clostridium akagii]|uniref:hypothetical protein n=1 Tax=Clostridium akagii TaxID=91623 RepID=UPI000AFAA593|nr:hypothetical protein [Clostridium akagii]
MARIVRIDIEPSISFEKFVKDKGLKVNKLTTTLECKLKKEYRDACKNGEIYYTVCKEI